MTEGPWGSPTEPDRPLPETRTAEPLPAREPMFNARLVDVWGLVLLVALVGLGYAGQQVLPGLLGEPNLYVLGALGRATLAEGWWWTPVTSMFLHGGLLHLVMNLSALLPFGMILSRRFGPGARGQLSFIAFYLIAGLAGGLAYLAIQSEPNALAVGASGAIFDLWGGVLRLSRTGRLLPPFSRAVLSQFTGPVIANVIVVLAFGLTGSGGIAWQAHLGGFVFGWLALGLFLPPRQRV